MKSKKITQKEILTQEITFKDLASLIYQTNISVDALSKKVDSLREEMLFEFKAIDERFDTVETRLDAIEARLDNVETRLDAIEVRLDNVETRLDKVETRLDKVEIRLDTIENRLDIVEQKIEILNVKFTKDFEKIYTNMINPYEFKSLVLKVEDIEKSL